MKINTRPGAMIIAGAMLILPATVFISFSLMKFEFDIAGPYDLIDPLLVSLGLREGLGFNINLLILFGPVLAFVLNMLSVLQIEFSFTKEMIDCRFSIRKSMGNLAVIILSSGLLLFLFAYAIGENCGC